MATNKIDALIENPTTVRSVIPIVFFGKSGSYLLSSFFDGHPEVLSVPFGALHHFVPKLQTFINDSGGRITPQTVFEFLRREAPNLFKDTLDYTSLDTPKGSNLGAEPERYARYLEAVLTNMGRRGSLSLAGLFNAVHIAYAAAIGQTVTTETPVIVWQQHYWINTEYRDFVRSCLPDVRYIMCTRLPEKGLDSHWAAGIRENQNLPFCHIPAHYLTLMVNSATIDPETETDNCISVRFEDMHTDTERLMRKLADWIGISWDPCLLDSTIDGRTWWYEKGPERFTGARPATGRDFSTKLMSPVDRHNLRYVLADRYAHWGYDRPPFPGRACRLIPRFVTEKILFRLPTRAQWVLLRHQVARAWREFVRENRAYRALLDDACARKGEAPYVRLVRPDDD